jgi:3-deoxy-D-manno-octulosonate 8-phosphate phosphatase (KDO 8-P phosphatase)
MLMVETLYTEVSTQLFDAAAQIKLLICDVDGVFSDGRIYMGNDGEELKAFHTRDGFGIKALLHAGVTVAVITGRRSSIVENRMTALGIKHIYQGQDNKVVAYDQLRQKLKLNASQCAYIGDDVIDIPVMERVGLAVAVADAHPLTRRAAGYITLTPGGYGAVRELCDLILQAQGVLDDAKGTSV